MNLKTKEIVTNIFAKSILKKEGRVFISRTSENQCVFEEPPYIILNLNHTDADDLFISHIEKRHKFKNARNYSPFLWTILHEIGHIKADTEEDAIAEQEKEALVKLLCSTADNEKEWNSAAILHFEMKSEWDATDWAIDFIKRHYLLCHIVDYLLK